MKVNGNNYRTIWYDKEYEDVKIIDQRFLPFKFVVETINSSDEMAEAIAEMHLRGAGLIGAAAAWGLFLAVKKSGKWEDIEKASEKLAATRPTAVNLQAALNKMNKALKNLKDDKRETAAFELAQGISDNDAESCRQIGINGLNIIKEIQNNKKGNRINILTHCNAGWLAFVDYGSALAPIYEAFDNGIDVHVYVDETRPRNQGARLTAWELGMHNVPHTLIADNTGGHLMQEGMIDMVIVGSDRVAANGDVANKIGTYLKALAAADNNIPFYVAFPSTTFDSNILHGSNIPIEERSPNEVLFIDGIYQGKEIEVRIAPEKTSAINFGFDITPNRLVTAYITEKGVFKANELL